MVASRLYRSMWRSALFCVPAFALVAPLAAQSAGQLSQASVARAARPAAGSVADVTFAADVAVIIQQNCQVCHQPGGIGPMSLTTYEEIRPWASMIKEKVTMREMPPYQYDTEVGIQEIKNDWRMTEEEIRTIADWVDAGAPMGDAADMPPPVSFPDGSTFRLADYFGRPPDVVVTSTPYDVPAVGADRWWRPLVESGITESRCIAGVETKPSLAARSVAHHANTTFRAPRVATPAAAADSASDDDDDAGGGGRLSEYAMGKIGEIVPPDACRRAPADGNVSWDIHYYPNGTEVKGATVSVGIWLHPADHAPEYRQNLQTYGTQSGSGDLEIPPQGTLMTEGYTRWDYPVRIDSWQPHGHLRLVGAKLEVLDPNTGRKELISMVSNWNAAWHHSHVYEDDVAPLIPAGHLLVRTQWYNNTDSNKYMQLLGGDPDMWVGIGDRTADEMSHQWIAVTHLDEERYQELLAERAAKAPEAASEARGAARN
jgi:mono/diheme cytochrome c family protein